jgi:nucleoside-diphosphate-sugar epimerase
MKAADRFLVTGSMGCLGSWVIRKLLDDGSELVAFDLSGDTRRLKLLASDDELGRVTFVRGDITDPNVVKAVVADHRISHIIHCAALQIPFVRANPPVGAQVNVTGTINVFEAALASAPQGRGLVYASAAGVFGPPELYPGGVVRDDSPRAPTTLYGVFKQTNEDSARIYWLEHKLPSIGLRPWIIYGPGRDQGMTSTVTVAMLAAAAVKPYRMAFGGESLFQFAPDVAAAFVAAARSTVDGARAFNIGGDTASIARIVERLEQVEPRSRGLITFDPTPLQVAARADTTGFDSVVGAVRFATIEEGVERTVTMFRNLLERGLVRPPD